MCNTLDLDTLKLNRIPGITEALGGALAEAASECLEDRGHDSGVAMQIDGDCVHRVQVLWTKHANPEQRARAWNDTEVATEWGAYGVVALLIHELTDYTIVEKARKGGGFDFWLGGKGSDDPLFQGKARLEVSGIREGDDQAVQARVKRKMRQTVPSDGTLPGVVAIVEFGAPRTRVKTK